jgi:glutamate formiminotransferase
VRAEAEGYGVGVTNSEVVGLIPLAALLDAACYALRLHSFDSEQILEMRLLAGEEEGD